MQTLTFAKSEYDAVIVGARCAGAATALLLARAGAGVLVIDKDAYGADTISTHALMRTGVLLLERWGVGSGIRKAGTPPVRQARFIYGPDEITIPIKPDSAVEALYAPRRTVLDRLLVDAAMDAGAVFSFKTPLEALTFDNTGRVRGAIARASDGTCRNISANIVIGADGRQSLVAEQVKANTIVSKSERTALVFGYFTGIDDQGYQWGYRKDNAIGAIPTNFGQHCLFASVPKRAFRETFGAGLLDGLIHQFRAHDPRLADQIDTGGMDGELRRFGGAPGHLRQACGPGWALVGDAGYFKDPLTAHGMTDALRDADLLARALCAGTEEALAAYQRTRDALSLPFLEVTAEIASFRWNPTTIRALHHRLNEAMKLEYASLARSTPTLKSAA